MIPLSVFLGVFALGIIATLNPCFWASDKRSDALKTGRTSPLNPTSPKAIQSFGMTLSYKLEAIAIITTRSEAVSLTLIPPTTFTKTS